MSRSSGQQRRISRPRLILIAFVIAILGGAAALGGVSLLGSAPVPTTTTPAAVNAPGVQVQVSRTNTTPGGSGLREHTQPSTSSPTILVAPEGATVTVHCFIPGTVVLGNGIWEAASYAGHDGWFPDYYLSTHWRTVADLVNQGIPDCRTPGGQAQTAVATINSIPANLAGVNLGTPDKTGFHMWGPCQVVDYHHSDHGWVIVGTKPNKAVVRDGMLWGWFDQGGAPGHLGCPKNSEYAYMNGERQDFTGGSLYWNPGMNHAQVIDPKTEGAIEWAWNCATHHGACSYNGKVPDYRGYCLGFVTNAFQYGAGWSLTGGPYGEDSYATQWWTARPRADQHPGDTNPPRGALVIWDRAAGGGAGHIGISLGGGWAISTKFGGNPYVHTFHIADQVNNYLGWVAAK